MRTKLIIPGAIVMLSLSTYVFAAQEHDDHEQKGSMMGQKSSMKEHHEEGEQKSEAIEVGNKICPGTGMNVESMGGVIKHEYNGKIYNLCCESCLKDFKNDPEKYSKIADERAAKELEEHKGSHSESKAASEEGRGLHQMGSLSESEASPEEGKDHYQLGNHSDSNELH